MAPIANMMNEETAATQGDGFSVGSTPSSWTRWKLIARFSSRWISSVARAAVSWLIPKLTSVAMSSARSALGWR